MPVLVRRRVHLEVTEARAHACTRASTCAAACSPEPMMPIVSASSRTRYFAAIAVVAPTRSAEMAWSCTMPSSSLVAMSHTSTNPEKSPRNSRRFWPLRSGNAICAASTLTAATPWQGTHARDYVQPRPRWLVMPIERHRDAPAREHLRALGAEVPVQFLDKPDRLAHRQQSGRILGGQYERRIQHRPDSLARDRRSNASGRNVICLITPFKQPNFSCRIPGIVPSGRRR